MAKRRKSHKKGRGGRPGGGNAVIRTVTPRQKEILRLVAQGLTNREIAHNLKISVRTVEVHRFNLMRRLKVRNVAQLLRQALLLRLLPKSFLTR
ncbi:MAG: response regulator transcription factor [Nitrospirae bacterium]|nr:response regulator transcription factor [Nitrospirota bacterium]MCZ6781143.1 LuxR C-terminal-related transcriptional regulator [Nitrospirota bacterium]